MKTKSFDIQRVKALLQYDWMMNKRMMGMTAVVIAAIYAFVAFVYFTGKAEVNAIQGEETLLSSAILGVFISTFFRYASLAVILVVTTVLTKKFCEPRTSTSYLTLPGTSIEKYVVMLIDYAVALAGLWIMYFVCYYLTMLVCVLLTPGFHMVYDATIYLNPIYSVSMIQELTNQQSFDEVAEMLNNAHPGFGNSLLKCLATCLAMAPFASLASFFFYLVLNMLFRSNCQIKSIALYYITSFAFAIIIVLVTIGTMFNVMIDPNVSEAVVLGKVQGILSAIEVVLWCMPALALVLMYVFYRQICGKQAK